MPKLCVHTLALLLAGCGEASSPTAHPAPAECNGSFDVGAPEPTAPDLQDGVGCRSGCRRIRRRAARHLGQERRFGKRHALRTRQRVRVPRPRRSADRRRLREGRGLRLRAGGGRHRHPTLVTVSAFGVVTPGTEPVELGSISLPLFSQSVSLGTLYPR